MIIKRTLTFFQTENVKYVNYENYLWRSIKGRLIFHELFNVNEKASYVINNDRNTIKGHTRQATAEFSKFVTIKLGGKHKTVNLLLSRDDIISIII